MRAPDFGHSYVAQHQAMRARSCRSLRLDRRSGPFVSFVSSGSPPLIGHWPKLSFAAQSLDQSLLFSPGICLAKSRPFTAIGLLRQDFPIIWHVQPTDKHPIVRPTLDLRSNWYHVIQLMRLASFSVSFLTSANAFCLAFFGVIALSIGD
jgi:hypothetical protein